ncbi:substrate-binding periplasmic protein [Chryseosolibacter indicus]|uniref:Transporter substrate-binding domain-containing protein n=1 Tax=Chryseosolibacter indicus TaxID=2782351 RepID=A0ABS5VM39_9BACT|nr:transporter substrate-binding domain-containing protein [Chryseosolibacter indicus]MBT1702525.1 transporter substrate-binding domain-containing protein [Chryseosolibacter indicus]
MKPILASLLALVASIQIIFAQNYSGDTWANVKSNKSGTLSLAYVETPSFVYKDKSGNLTGICIDIMNDFVKWVNTAKGVKLTSKYVGDGTSFRGMYDKTKAGNGGVIGLGNITITEERKKEVKFTQPFITNFAILITQTSVPTLSKLEDLPKTFANFTAYTAKGTLNEKRIADLKQKYYPSVKVSNETTSQEVLEKVFADPTGFAYLDLAFYIEAVQMKKPVKRHPVGDKASEQFGFIMPMNSDWAPVVEEFFASNGGYFNSKEYKSILVKHLGESGVKLLQKAK